MITIKTVYMIQYEGNGIWLGEEPIELEAECEQFGDSVLVVWTDECLARLAAADLDGDELVGCTEAIEEAFFEAEQEECRLANVRQRNSERAA